MDVEILDILATEANKVEDLVRRKDHVAFLRPRLRTEASHYFTIDDCSVRQPAPQTVENRRGGRAVMGHGTENIHEAAAAEQQSSSSKHR